MTDIVISAENIGKCYRVYDSSRSRLMNAFLPGRGRGVEELWALRNVSFVIRKGESVALIGRNGGGKSTLLEILTGTLTPTTGSVSVHGRVCALLELGSGFNPEYTGRENVILNGLLLGLTKAEIVSRLGEIEAFAEIGSAIDRPVKTYSSGMMVRLAFAVQVLSDPDILIIDEALSVGDFFFQQKCMSYIRGLKERGVTLLFVSHDMGAVRDVCERGIVMNRGTVAFDGENLEAIRIYLNPDSMTETALFGEPSETSETGMLEGAAWSRSTPDLSKAVSLTSAAMYDLQQTPITAVRMGDKVKFRCSFVAMQAGTYHAHLNIKNRSNQLVVSTGSFNTGINAPQAETGQTLICEFDIQLSIEAGPYVYAMSLVQPSSDGASGIVLDETPWLGPVNIHWNYEQSPPPFYGMAGMNCTAGFSSIPRGKTDHNPQLGALDRCAGKPLPR